MKVDLKLVKTGDNVTGKEEHNYIAEYNDHDNKVILTYIDEEKTKNEVIIENDKVTINNKNKLVIEENEEFETKYKTQLGDVNLKVKGNRVDNKIKEGSLKLAYDVYVEGDFMAENQMTIDIKER